MAETGLVSLAERRWVVCQEKGQEIVRRRGRLSVSEKEVRSETPLKTVKSTLLAHPDQEPALANA
jgi:hypothetical protein